jgi:hypothetical protein
MNVGSARRSCWLTAVPGNAQLGTDLAHGPALGVQVRCTQPARDRAGGRRPDHPARKQLFKQGLDAGAETIAAHLAAAGVSPVPAVSTI